MFKKKTVKTIITFAVMFMVLLAAVVLIGKATDGTFSDFKNASLRSPNEDNLYQTISITKSGKYVADGTGADGVTVKVDDDNVLTVNGKPSSNLEIEIGTVSLTAGTNYLFDSNILSGSGTTVYLTLENSSGTVLASSYDGAVTIAGTSVSTGTYTLVLHVQKDVNCHNLKVTPVICTGSDVEDVESFWVLK